jgi:hypothetical protein
MTTHRTKAWARLYEIGQCFLVLSPSLFSNPWFLSALTPATLPSSFKLFLPRQQGLHVTTLDPFPSKLIKPIFYPFRKSLRYSWAILIKQPGGVLIVAPGNNMHLGKNRFITSKISGPLADCERVNWRKWYLRMSLITSCKPQFSPPMPRTCFV